MPKGVEHSRPAIRFALAPLVREPQMPKGVEHGTQRPAMLAKDA